MIVIDVGDDPEVSEGNAGAFVVLNFEREWAVFFVGLADFAIDPGILVDEDPLI